MLLFVLILLIIKFEGFLETLQIWKKKNDLYNSH